jgi:uncharacterized protein (TIRG00374 family)
MTDVSATHRELSMPRIVSWQTAIALGIAVALLAFLATSFDPDFGGVRERVRHSDLLLIAPAFAAHYASLVVRGFRWRRMLVASREPNTGEVPSGLTCSLYLLLCWFVNAISWLRLGNVYRSYLVSRRTGGSIFWALGTVVSERLLDLAAVLLMLMVAGGLLVSSDDSGRVWPFLATAAGVTLVLAVVFVVMRRNGAAVIRLLPWRLHAGYERFAAAALATLRRDDLPVLWTMTLAGWGLEAARLWLVVLALHLDMSFQMVVFVTFAQGLLISAPLTPGGLGVVEPGLTGVLLFAFDRPEGVSITLIDRAISYVSVILVGAGVFATREALSLPRRRLLDDARPDEARLPAPKPGRGWG